MNTFGNIKTNIEETGDKISKKTGIQKVYV